ncbi:hypothetical protein CGRA01v4_10000 [Colletotrichum graminicola]|nr:hypothetical protein CGRA01v4_10000 [Colletotrichum graminicola]
MKAHSSMLIIFCSDLTIDLTALESTTTTGYLTQDPHMMKPTRTTLLLLATMTSVLAAPVADANIVMADPESRSEYHTSWVEDSTVSSWWTPLSPPTFKADSQFLTRSDGQKPWLRKRAAGKGDPCNPGKGQCVTGLGCYSCGNHQPVCQQGPGSNQCCYRDNTNSVAVCDRL